MAVIRKQRNVCGQSLWVRLYSAIEMGLMARDPERSIQEARNGSRHRPDDSPPDAHVPSCHHAPNYSDT